MNKQTVEINSAEYKEYIDRGHNHLKQGNFPEAIASYRKAIEFKPQALPGYINLGSLLAKLGNIEEATAILKQAIQKSPNQAIAYVSLASLYIKEGNIDSSQNLFNKAVELDKNQPLWVYYHASIPATDIMKVEKYKIAYTPMPKCASSTLKSIFYNLETEKNVINPHQFYNNPFLKTQNINIAAYQDYFKFVVIRDPIKRFLSYYNKNIITEKSLLKHYGNKRFVFGLDCLPDINFFIEHLEDYIYTFRDVHHHTLCQSAYVDSYLNHYDLVCKIENLNDLLARLSKICKKKLSSPNLMKSKKKVSNIFYSLSLKSLHKLIEYYAKDYALLQDYYSSEVILKEYKNWLLNSL